MLQQRVTKVIAANYINMSVWAKPIKTKLFPSKEPKLFSFPFSGCHSTLRSLTPQHDSCQVHIKLLMSTVKKKKSHRLFSSGLNPSVILSEM